MISDVTSVTGRVSKFPLIMKTNSSPTRRYDIGGYRIRGNKSHGGGKNREIVIDEYNDELGSHIIVLRNGNKREGFSYRTVTMK